MNINESGGMSHADTAKLILQRVEQDPGWYGDIPDMETLARAQVHATLALVEALRP